MVCIEQKSGKGRDSVMSGLRTGYDLSHKRSEKGFLSLPGQNLLNLP